MVANKDQGPFTTERAVIVPTTIADKGSNTVSGSNTATSPITTKAADATNECPREQLCSPRACLKHNRAGGQRADGEYLCDRWGKPRQTPLSIHLQAFGYVSFLRNLVFLVLNFVLSAILQTTIHRRCGAAHWQPRASG
jgi:hypothetical protein